MNEIYKKIGEKYNLSATKIKKIYNAFWGKIKEKIENTKLVTDEELENFEKVRASYVISKLGKLGATKDRVISLKKQYKYRKEHNIIKDYDENKENKTNVHISNNNNE